MQDTSLRHLFPIFNQAYPKERWIYFDSAATSQKPTSVLMAISTFYEKQNANVHRASHKVARETTNQFEHARIKVQDFINAASSSEIVWTKGATESINLVAQGLSKSYFKTGDRILIAASEHHANLVPWLEIAKTLNMHIDVIPMTDKGVLDIPAGLAMLQENTALVAVAQVSNALGNINDIGPLLLEAKRFNALTLVDGAQACAHLKVDVQQMDCDFYVFSGHKMFAPTGIGVLYGKQPLLEMMPPYQLGGEMIKKVSFSGVDFQALPFKFEAGTPNIEGVFGMSAAVDFIEHHRPQIEHHEAQLYRCLLETLSRIATVKLWGDNDASIAIQSFTVEGVNNQDLGLLLNEQNIAIRVGHHCAMPLMDALGIDGTLRVSLACYNEIEEVQLFGEALVAAIKQLQDLAETNILPCPANIAEMPIAENIRAARGWDESYRQIMLAGKGLNRLAEHLRTAEHEVFGCESQVWIRLTTKGSKLNVELDSPSKIVRGLLAIIVEPLERMPVSEIVNFDVEVYLQSLDLHRHLSQSRGNGLIAVINRIKQWAATAQ